MRFRELVRALAHPGVFPGCDGAAVVRANPASVSFAVPTRVYKLARPGNGAPRRGVLARRRECEALYRLNRRVSDEVYLGIAAVLSNESQAGSGLGVPVLVVDPNESPGGVVHELTGSVPGTIDWLSVARVAEPNETLAGLAKRRRALAVQTPGRAEADVRQLVAQLAGKLAIFHARARTGPRVNQHGLVDELERYLWQHVEALVGCTGDRALARRIEVTAAHALSRVREGRRWFERRIASWRVRDGHGGLRAEVIAIEAGRPSVRDCGDYPWGRRCGDVARDLARLTVDLELEGAEPWSRQLLEAYVECSGDDSLHRVWPFYRTLGALERAAGELSGARARTSASGPAAIEQLAPLELAARYERV